MKKQILMFLVALLCTFSSFAVSPIIGPHTICTMDSGRGSSLALIDSVRGGIWSTSNPSILSIYDTSSTASVSQVVLFSFTPGTATITYTVGSSYVTHTVIAGNNTPTLVSGSTHLCIGDTTVLVSSESSGTWCAGGILYSDCGPSGMIVALHDGVTFVSHNSYPYCNLTVTITVGVGNDSISGPSIMCVGSTASFTDPVSGGTWSSSNASIATISSGGLVTGVAAGTAILSYHLIGTSCGPTDATEVITIASPITPATIAYTSAMIHVGELDTLTDATPGGVWTSSNLSVATVNGFTGVVTGVAPGTCIISYAVCGATAVTTVLSVSSLDGISGHINFSGYAPGADIIVWLIQYNPSTMMLTAVDSLVITPAMGNNKYYKFTGLASDSFRIKASVRYTSFFGFDGYVPTYSNASLYWNTANVVNHITGNSDINNDVNMIEGIRAGGPGFISGDVTTGANRGASTSVPAVGLALFLINSSNHVVDMTQTDVSGHYEFANLPVGTSYKIVPDALSYNSIPYTSISLTSSAPSMSAANFVQHTLSKTITPITEGVSNIGSTENTVLVYPNPTNGALNVAWNANASEVGTLILSDISGRELLNKTLNIRQGSGSEQVDLSGYSNGIYFLSLRSGQINYNTKIQVNY